MHFLLEVSHPCNRDAFLLLYFWHLQTNPFIDYDTRTASAFLSVESKPEKSGVSESMQAPSVRPYRGAYELKKSRRASYDTLIHHVAGVDEGIHS